MSKHQQPKIRLEVRMLASAVNTWPGRTLQELAKLYSIRLGMEFTEISNIFEKRWKEALALGVIRRHDDKSCGVSGETRPSFIPDLD